MADGLGITSKAAFLKDNEDSSWPVTSPGTIGSGDEVPFVAESVKVEPMAERDGTLEGKAGLRTVDTVGWNFRGQVTLRARYNNIGRVITMAMGYENPNDPGATYHGSPETVSGKSKHVIEQDDVLATQTWQTGERLPSGAGGGTYNSSTDKKVRRGVLAFAKGVTDWRFYSAMITRMTIRIENEGKVFIELEFVCHSYARGSYNSANWTLASDQSNVITPHCSFEIDGNSKGLARGEITLDNHLAFERDTASGLYIAEPRREHFRDTVFGFDFLRYNEDTYMDAYDAGSGHYCSFQFSTGNYKFNIYFNAFKFEKVTAPVAGPGIIRSQHTCRAYRPSSDNYSGEWSNISLIQNNEMIVLLQNDESSNYLTEN